MNYRDMLNARDAGLQLAHLTQKYAQVTDHLHDHDREELQRTVEEVIAAAVALGGVDPGPGPGPDLTLREELAAAGGTDLITYLPGGRKGKPRKLTDKLNEYRSIKDKGATGDGITDEYGAFQAALDDGGIWYIPAGRYRNATATWHIRSFTTLILEPGAVIVNDITDPAWQSGALFANGPIGGVVAGGYEGSSDIAIIGGVFDGTPRTARGSLTSFFNMAHSRRLTFSNAQFIRPGGNTHAIEVNSSQDVLFDRCEFDGFTPLDAQLGTREYINLDQSSPTGFPAFGPWDDTPCDNVTIRRCIFKNGDVAAGSHSSTPVHPNTRVRVLDCEIVNMTSRGLNFLYWKDSIVRGNTMRNTNVGIRCLYGRNILIEGNRLDEMDGLAVSIGGGAPGILSEGVILLANTVGRSGGIVVNSTHHSLVCDTIFTDMAGIMSTCIAGLSDIHGTRFRNNIAITEMGLRQMYRDIVSMPDQFIEIDGKFFVYIPNDAVGYVPDQSRPLQQGVTLISTNSGSITTGPCGLFWTRTAIGAASIRSLVQWNTSPVAVTTGELTGTTGAVGTTTIGAGTLRLAIENRSGGNRTYEVTYL